MEKRRTRHKLKLPREFRAVAFEERVDNVQNTPPYQYPFVWPPMLLPVPPMYQPPVQSIQRDRFPAMPRAPLEDHNFLIPSDNPRERAFREWEEERQRLRIKAKVTEKRDEIARALSDQEALESIRYKDALLRFEERERKSAERRKFEFQAALVIQKNIRGYLVRKRFPNMKYNDVMLVKDPVLYAAEKFLHEIITEEFIPDSVVDICEFHQSPITNTKTFKLHRLKRYLLDSVCASLMESEIVGWMEEFAVAATYTQDQLRPLSPDCDASGWFMCDIIHEDLLIISKEAIDDFIMEALTNSKAIVAFDIIHENVLDEMELILDSLLDAMCGYILWDMLVEDQISFEIRRNLLHYQRDFKKQILINPRTDHLSSTVTNILEYILDLTFMSHLTTHIASRGASFLEWDLGEQIVDAVLADALLARYFSMREVQFDNSQNKDPDAKYDE